MNAKMLKFGRHGGYVGWRTRMLALVVLRVLTSECHRM